VHRYEKLYIAPGATIDLSAFWCEVEQNNIPLTKIGISPITAILQDIDSEFERGNCDLEGNPIKGEIGGYLARTGTTAQGCGINRARRLIRHGKARYARDVPKLRRLLCDVPEEIMRRLDDGQSGLFEIAQGFQLSYLLPEFFPHTTSRNCTVAAGLDDLMVPPCYGGNVVLNFRTYPIRINSRKYVDRRSGLHLTMDEVVARTGGPFESLTKEALDAVGIELIEGDSGGCYSDQTETSWDECVASISFPQRATIRIPSF
jgi:adenylosuccinate synthase